MKQSVQDLRDSLARFQTIVSEGALLSFSAEARESLLAEAHGHLRKLEGLAEGALTIGLLGGTGVGKSSIMNALAGSEIASTSYRRPHTGQVLIYRHATGVVPADLRQAAVPWREITHQADSIRQVLLCDLPDFDSLLGLHRAYVIGFLEHLDVLVWVTSPEKYADESFYAFLREVPKAKQNFYFVLNKADLLFEGQPAEAGYDQLARVTASLQHYLTANGVPHPLIYALSAGQIMELQAAAPWNQFASFRRQVFQHRDMKEVMAIKAANLDVEVQQLLSMLDREVPTLAFLRQTLEKLRVELEARRGEWAAVGDRAFELGLAAHLQKDIGWWIEDSAALTGPGRALAVAVHTARNWLGNAPDRAAGVKLLLDGIGGASLQRELQRVEDHLVQLLLSRSLPATYHHQLESLVNAGGRWEECRSRLHYSLEMRLANARSPSFGGFRGSQYLVYALLTILLVMAVVGEPALRAFLLNPSWPGLAGLVATALANLFSPSGLAALGTYILLSLFFAVRFYGRFKKLLQRHTQKFIESLKLELRKVWEGELDSIVDRLRGCEQELQGQMSAIEGLHQKRRRD